MCPSTPSDSSPHEGATLVITHRVRPGKLEEYEDWINEISPLSRATPGHLDWHIVRPIAGLSETYTIIIRYDTTAHLRQWVESPTRVGLIEKVQPLLVTGDDFFISSGLDFWFTPSGAKATVPVRWKQYLITLSAIYPLVLAVPRLLAPLLRKLHIADYPLLSTLAVCMILVYLMVYVIMPRYTKLMRNWLFK